MEAETEGQNTPPEALKGSNSAETAQVQSADGENAEGPAAKEVEAEKAEESEKTAEKEQGQGQKEQENKEENDGEDDNDDDDNDGADDDDADEDEDDDVVDGEKEESERNEGSGSRASHDRRQKKHIVKLGPREFKNSKTMLHFFLDLFRGWPQNCNVNKYEHMMLEDLLMKGHPEAQKKVGPGIAAFQVRINPEYGCPSFYVIRKDGTAEDFSYRKCVDNLLPLPSHLKPQQDKLKFSVNRRGQGGGKGGHHGKGGRGGFGRGGGGGRAKRRRLNRKV